VKIQEERGGRNR